MYAVFLFRLSLVLLYLFLSMICAACTEATLLSRMYEFAQKASAGITMDDVKKKLVVPSTYAPNLQNADNITLENVEISVEVLCYTLKNWRFSMDLVGFLCHFVFSMQAVKGALHMLENGASIADAKSVCPPNVLFQLVKWKVHGNVELSS